MGWSLVQVRMGGLLIHSDPFALINLHLFCLQRRPPLRSVPDIQSWVVAWQLSIARVNPFEASFSGLDYGRDSVADLKVHFFGASARDHAFDEIVPTHVLSARCSKTLSCRPIPSTTLRSQTDEGSLTARRG